MKYFINFAIVVTPGQPEDVPVDVLEPQGLQRNPEVFDQLKQGNQWGLTDVYVHCNLMYENGAKFSGMATVRKSYASKEGILLREAELMPFKESAWLKMLANLRCQCEALGCSCPQIEMPEKEGFWTSTIQYVED